MKASPSAKTISIAILPLAFAALSLSQMLSPQLLSIRSFISYPYLFNGFLVALGEKVHYIGHPGIPFSLLLGVFVRITHALLPAAGPISAASLLIEHEKILAVISPVLALLNSAALFIFGLRARRKFSLLHVLVAQALFFISPHVVQMSTHLRPDALIVAISCINALFLLDLLPLHAFPFFLGTLLSMKHVFISFVAELVLFKNLFRALLALVITASTYAVYGFYLDFPCFACEGADYLRIYWSRLLGRHVPHQDSDFYLNANSWATYIQPTELFMNSGALAITLLVGAVGVYAARRPQPGKNLLSPLRVAVTVFLSQIALMLIYPLKFYFLFPAFGLVPLVYLLSVERLPEIATTLGKIVSGLLLVNCAYLYFAFSFERKELAENVQFRQKQESYFNRYSGCSFFLGASTGGKPADFFNANRAANFKFSPELAARLPKHYFFEYTIGEYADFSGSIVGKKPLDAAKRSGDCVVLVTKQKSEMREFQAVLGKRAVVKEEMPPFSNNLLYFPGNHGPAP